MTNEDLARVIMALIAFVTGYVIAQWKYRQSVERRLDGHRKAIDLIVDSVEKRDKKHRELLEGVTKQLVAIMDRMPQSRKPPEA